MNHLSRRFLISMRSAFWQDTSWRLISFGILVSSAVWLWLWQRQTRQNRFFADSPFLFSAAEWFVLLTAVDLLLIWQFSSKSRSLRWFSFAVLVANHLLAYLLLWKLIMSHGARI